MDSKSLCAADPVNNADVLLELETEAGFVNVRSLGKCFEPAVIWYRYSGLRGIRLSSWYLPKWKALGDCDSFELLLLSDFLELFVPDFENIMRFYYN